MKYSELDEWDKLRVYMHYYCKQLALSNSIHIVEMIGDSWDHGYGEFDRVSNICGIKKFSPFNIMSFETFKAAENHGLKDYLFRFKEEL